MDIHLTSVSHGKLGRQLVDLYRPMNRTLRQRLGDKNYGSGVEAWFLLFGMLPEGLGGHDSSERKQFKKRERAFDLRLHISNEAFKNADQAGRQALIFNCILRSIDIMAEKNVPDFDVDALRSDIKAVALNEGWTADV